MEYIFFLLQCFIQLPSQPTIITSSPISRPLQLIPVHFYVLRKQSRTLWKIGWHGWLKIQLKVFINKFWARPQKPKLQDYKEYISTFPIYGGMSWFVLLLYLFFFIYFYTRFLVELVVIFPSIGIVDLSKTLYFIYTENRGFRLGEKIQTIIIYLTIYLQHKKIIYTRNTILLWLTAWIIHYGRGVR